MKRIISLVIIAVLTITCVNGVSTDIFAKNNRAKARKTKLKKIKAKKHRKVIVKWKKLKGVNGYQLIYSKNKKFKKSKRIIIKNAGIKKKVIKKLKAKKKYYFKIRTFNIIHNPITKKDETVYGKWSKVKKAKTKK